MIINKKLIDFSGTKAVRIFMMINITMWLFDYLGSSKIDEWGDDMETQAHFEGKLKEKLRLVCSARRPDVCQGFVMRRHFSSKLKVVLNKWAARPWRGGECLMWLYLEVISDAWPNEGLFLKCSSLITQDPPSWWSASEMRTIFRSERSMQGLTHDIDALVM